MNLRAAFAVSAALATITALAEPAHSHAKASLGDRIEVADGIMIQPVAVIEDSRCPVGLTCVWAGRLVIRADVYAANRFLPLTLTLGVPKSIPGGALTLTSASPMRKARAGRVRHRNQYRFEFSYAPAPAGN